MDDSNQLLNDLKSPDPEARQQATQSLWIRWYQEFGKAAEQKLHEGIHFMDSGQLDRAQSVFQDM